MSDEVLKLQNTEPEFPRIHTRLCLKGTTAYEGSLVPRQISVSALFQSKRQNRLGERKEDRALEWVANWGKVGEKTSAYR